MPKYFKFPFASGGDKTAVPDDAQVDGSVSYSTGWGFDYQRDPDPLVDPLTKDIPRDQTNQLGFDITDNIKFIQDNTAPAWAAERAAAGGYPRNARVSVGGVIYISTVNANASTPGASATWITGGETDPTLVAIANLTPTANTYIWFPSTDVADLATITSFGRTWNAAADDAAGRALLGITTAGTGSSGLVSFATDSEVNSGANVAKVANPRQLRMGFSISLGANGWVLMPSWLGGYGLVWGTASVPKNGFSFISLPFPTNNFFFAAGFAQDMGRGDISCSAVRNSASQAQIYYHRDGSGGGNVNCWYFGVGN